MGLYLSPWDRHEKSYGTDSYNIYYQNQLKELLTGYGKISEIWLDGANGEGPNGIIQEYNYDAYYATIRHYQPDALIASMGPDVRWIGNEIGLAEETEWCIQPKTLTIQRGDPVWYPSECDVSIRPGWFYHETENQQVKTADKLIDIYMKSVGRNSNLLLNIPPNKDGLISIEDADAIVSFKQKLNNIFATDLFYRKNIQSSSTRNNSAGYSPDKCLDKNRKTFWISDKSALSAELVINLNQPTKINIMRLEEAIEYGQRIKSFSILAEKDAEWKEISGGTTVGRSRILTFEPVTTQKIKIVIHDSYAAPAIREIQGFYSHYFE